MDTRPTHVGDSRLPYVEQQNLIGRYLRARQLNLPNSYLVFDIETDSVNVVSGNILQVGFAQVIDGELTNSGAVFVSTPEPVLQAYEYGDYVRKQQAAGNDGYVKAADVRRYGLPPAQVFLKFAELVKANVDSPAGNFFVGHNSARFDIPFIESYAGRAGVPIKIPRNRVFDTGAMYKAQKMGRVPPDDQDMFSFFLQIASTKAQGVFWKLELAVQEWGLVEKYGLDLKQAHDAASDCLFTHYLYQAFRERYEGAAV